MNTNIIDREAAVQDIKDTAAEASHHSSGDVLNMANPNSRYAHGKFERTGSVNENTNMPTTNTTVAGAYDIGNTSTTDVTSNYDNKFTEPETHTVGTGSRTVQALPEEVHDLGSTVQTQRTTHVLQTQAEPVQYIAPQQHVSSFGTNTSTSNTGSGIPHSTGRTNLAGVAAAGGVSSHAHAQTGTGAAYESGTAYGSNNTTSTNTAADTLGTTTTTTTSATHHDGGVSHHTTGLPAGQSGVVQHHGLVGENRTLEPTQAAYNVNAASGSAVGTGLLGMPHGTAGTAAGTTTTSSSTNHNSSTTTGAGHSDNAEKPQKESFLSKIKHALHK